MWASNFNNFVGNENFATNLRLSTVIELMKNAKFYLDKDVFENDITYSTTALDSSELAKKKSLTMKFLKFIQNFMNTLQK